MRAYLRGSKKSQQKTATKPKGKQSVRKLTKQGAVLESIEVKNGSVKRFRRVARKYGIDFAVKRDTSEKYAKYLIFFKSRDAASMTAAFKEFSTRELHKSKEKPPITKTLQRMNERVKNQDLNRTRQRNRGRER